MCIIYGKLMLRVLLYAAFHLVHAHARVYNSRHTRTLYSKICPSNASEHKPILTAANGSAFFRLASAMNGNTSESIPQVRLPTEHITEIEIVVDILYPPSFANSIPQYGWNGKNNAVQTINPHVNS